MNHVLNDMSVSIDAPVQAYVWWDILSPQPWLKCCSDGAECNAMFTKDKNIKNGVCLRWQETQLLIPLSGLQIFGGQYWNPSTNHGQYQEWPVHLSPHPNCVHLKVQWEGPESSQEVRPPRFINPYQKKPRVKQGKVVRQLSNSAGVSPADTTHTKWWF